MNHELLDVQGGFRKGRGTRDPIANICWIIGKAGAFQKNIYFCFIDYAKAFDCVQFSSVAQLCLTLCDPMDCSMPGPPSITNSWSLLKPCPLSRWCHLTISSSVIPFSSCPQSFPASGSFPVSQLFTPGGQNIGVSASASVLPMNTQD